MVERGGFEPPKASPADLQSAPFGRSGTSPQKKFPFAVNLRQFFQPGAGDGIRTRNLLITNQLLYR
jgi:hypothetical protein